MNRHKPDSCSGCAFESAGTDFSQIDGTGSSGVMLVGEASGEFEARDQLPFRPFAPAGSVLERVIRRMGLSREMFSITNACRCRPKNNWLENNPFEHAALNHCRPNLDAAIAQRKPRAIVALGGVATRELTGLAGEALGVSHLAGYVLPLSVPVKVPCPDCAKLAKCDPDCFYCGGEGWIDGTETHVTPVVPNFHPAYLRRGKASHQGVFARILQRALNVASGKDRGWMWGVDPEDQSTYAPLDYLTHPDVRSVADYVAHVRAHPELTLSYDLETSESASLDEDAREGFIDTRIRLAQFCCESGRAIALDWDQHGEAARILLSLPNVKCGHNIWLFDDKVLRAATGTIPSGVRHDTLQMFHHWQPDLPAHLQFAASFVQFPFPWKHLAASDLPFYGCCDVDATLRLYNMLEATLRRDQLWGDDTLGYIGQVYRVRPVLEQMELRGIPIDDQARRALGIEFDLAQRELGGELATLAPRECCRVHPKQGYKGMPPEVKAKLAEWGMEWEADPKIGQGPLAVSKLSAERFTESGDDPELYHYELRSFSVPAVDAASGEPVSVPTTRWCRVYDFNPNSWQQLISYMNARGHKVPKSREEDDDGNQKDTTSKKELVRLSHSTGDTFYLRVIEFRELSKAKGTYVDGFAPGPDGRVHTTFSFDTGTGQLAAKNPNVTNFPKHIRLAKQLRMMVAAPDGYIIVEVDKKSYHVLTTGFCAEDAEYMRMARLDMHSFVAGHALKCWDASRIITESDGELLDRFKWFKSDPARKLVRDKQAKPTILGVGFGMGYRRLYQENMEHFSKEAEAKKFLSILQQLFPKVFAWQQRIRKLAHDRQSLISPHGHIRRFYEVFRWDTRRCDWAPGDQADEAVAFLPANMAFGEMRELLKEQHRLGLDERFGLCNSIHDSFVYCFPRPLRDEFLATVIPVLTAPSKVLRHPTLAPDGLVVDVDVNEGQNWSNMQEVPVVHSATKEALPA